MPLLTVLIVTTLVVSVFIVALTIRITHTRSIGLAAERSMRTKRSTRTEGTISTEELVRLTNPVDVHMYISVRKWKAWGADTGMSREQACGSGPQQRSKLYVLIVTIPIIAVL